MYLKKKKTRTRKGLRCKCPEGNQVNKELKGSNLVSKPWLRISKLGLLDSKVSKHGARVSKQWRGWNWIIRIFEKGERHYVLDLILIPDFELNVNQSKGWGLTIRGLIRFDLMTGCVNFASPHQCFQIKECWDLGTRVRPLGVILKYWDP